MLTLVESINILGVSDRPDLGCAMLIAACQEKGIKTNLVKGQTYYLKNMFIRDTEELWDLINNIKEEGPRKREFKKSIQKKGIIQFQNELRHLYQYVIVDKDPRHYFDSLKLLQFSNFLAYFLSVYQYYLRELKHDNLKIVERYVSEIIKSNPRYIGFSLGWYSYHRTFDPLTRIIRKRIKEMTGLPIIVGGSPTCFLDLKHLDKIFEEECFDYLVIGAGDQALPSLIESLEEKREPKGIANVFYRKNGKVKGNDLKVINDLDSLPYPDYSQFDLDLYLGPKRILPFQTARGCNWKKCAFCSHHMIYLDTHKTYSIEKVVETIAHLKDAYNCSHFAFHDEGLYPKRARMISGAILDNNLRDIYIYTYARLANGYNDNNLLHIMRKAGFTLVHWGLESGCQRVLDLMDKGTRISTASQILKKSTRNKIGNMCFVLFGFPGEMKKEAEETIEFLKRHADCIDDFSCGRFYLRPYSPVGINPEKWGVEIKRNKTYMSKSGMSQEETNSFYERFLGEFNLNNIKLYSDKFKYILPQYSGHRMLRFMNSSYGLISNKVALGYIGKGKAGSIFPIILGEVKTSGNKITLYPIDVCETLFINENLPVKSVILSHLEKGLYDRSKGRLSIEDIISTVCKEAPSCYKRQDIHRKCMEFFNKIFSKNWGLAFTESWKDY